MEDEAAARREKCAGCLPDMMTTKSKTLKNHQKSIFNLVLTWKEQFSPGL